MRHLWGNFKAFPLRPMWGSGILWESGIAPVTYCAFENELIMAIVFLIGMPDDWVDRGP